MLSSLLSGGAVGKREINYDSLSGRPKSFAKECGGYALQGEVPLKSADGYEVATFAAGCFWGTELHFQRIPGVVATCVGYTQGTEERPTYAQVSSGKSGHTEGIQLIFDPKHCSYATLCDKLLALVDPTVQNRVGGDSFFHFFFAHPPISPICRTPLFPYLTFYSFFLGGRRLRYPVPPRDLSAWGGADGGGEGAGWWSAAEAQPEDSHRAQACRHLLARGGVPPEIPRKGRTVRTASECRQGSGRGGALLRVTIGSEDQTVGEVHVEISRGSHGWSSVLISSGQSDL